VESLGGMAPKRRRIIDSIRAASKSPTATTAISSGRYHLRWKARSPAAVAPRMLSGVPMGRRFP